MAAQAAAYYIATGGSDNNNGSLGSPFGSFTKAINTAAAGDTIFVRGGTYNLTIAITISKVGTAASPFRLFAYDNETPILDFRGETFSGANSGARGIDLQSNFWHIKGLTVQYAADNGIIVSGSNNTLERLVTRQNQDTGLAIQGSGSRIPSNNLVLNCDSYGNFDYNLASSGSAPGENADGFIAKFRQVGPGNYFIGNRAYNNADDGYDFWEAANSVTVIKCQSFHNGLSSEFRTAAGARSQVTRAMAMASSSATIVPPTCSGATWPGETLTMASISMAMPHRSSFPANPLARCDGLQFDCLQ